MTHGKNSIQTALMDGQEMLVSKANLAVSNVRIMEPLWRGVKRVVVGPHPETAVHEVKRAFGVFKDPEVVAAIGVSTKTIQFRTVVNTAFHLYYYRFIGNENVLRRISGVITVEPDTYGGATLHTAQTLPGDSGSPMLAGQQDFVGIRLGVLQVERADPLSRWPLTLARF